jgi:hypothetical protein
VGERAGGRASGRTSGPRDMDVSDIGDDLGS